MIGRCGFREHDTYYATTREFMALSEGKAAEFRERLDIARWEKFMDARMNPNVTHKPDSVYDFVTFAWEQEERPKAERVPCDMSDDEAAAIGKLMFKKFSNNG